MVPEKNKMKPHDDNVLISVRDTNTGERLFLNIFITFSFTVLDDHNNNLFWKTNREKFIQQTPTCASSEKKQFIKLWGTN